MTTTKKTPTPQLADGSTDMDDRIRWLSWRAALKQTADQLEDIERTEVLETKTIKVAAVSLALLTTDAIDSAKLSRQRRLAEEDAALSSTQSWAYLAARAKAEASN